MRARTLTSLLLVLALAAPAVAQTPPPPATPPEANLQLTVRLGTLDGAGKKSVARTFQVVLAEGQETRLLAGSRIPLPTTTDEKGTQFVYQNIGFSLTASAHLQPGGRILLQALLEDSRVKGSGGAGGPGAFGAPPAPGGIPPTVETRQLQVRALLADKVPLEITRVEGLLDQPGFVEVEARILR